MCDWGQIFRPVTHDNASVCYILPEICLYVGLVDKEYRVCAFQLAWHSLHEAFKFSAVRFSSDSTAPGVDEEVTVLHELACFFIEDCGKKLLWVLPA